MTKIAGLSLKEKTYSFKKNKFVGKKTLTNFIALIECNSPKHDTCYRIQHELMKKFNNVMESYTTDVIIEDKHYCICATGFITYDKDNAIKRAINKLTWRNNRVKYTKLLLNDS